MAGSRLSREPRLLLVVLTFLVQSLYGNAGTTSQQPPTTTPRQTTPHTTPSHPTTTQPTSAHPATTKPTSAHPATTKPTSVHPATTKTTSSHPATTKPTPSHPATTKPSSAHPATTKPTSAHPATTKPTSVHPATTKTTSSHPPITQPTSLRSPITQPTTGHPPSTPMHTLGATRSPSQNCTNTDHLTTADKFGRSCSSYVGHKDWCGMYDTTTFQSYVMCCICGGGHSQSRPAIQDDEWEVSSQNSCQGTVREYDTCPDQPACGGCVPVDCQWDFWASWFDSGGCAGICTRSRSIARQNSECGTPCHGAKTETKRCLKPRCQETPQNCQFSDWGQWSPSHCVNPTDQKYRERHVVQPPANGGRPCESNTRETAPCLGAAHAVDCEFTTWHSWTVCSKPCNNGRKTRMRRVAQNGLHGGRPCAGGLENTMPCNMHACAGARNCMLGQWQQWSACHSQTATHQNQKLRSRDIVEPAKEGGESCVGQLKETAGCTQTPVPCKISSWSPWQVCDQTCDGGQRLRTRSLVNEASDGGKCPLTSLRETAPCDTVPCDAPGPGDCEVSTWEDWSTCSSRCGWGLQKRSRRVVSLAQGGKGCQGALEEVTACQLLHCERIDCLWDLWSDWSACTCTCGGGTMRRTRVVKRAPENGGTDCNAQYKGEVAPCNMNTCSHNCIDGLWDDWSTWSTCSATCDEGFRSRRRDIAQEPNVCGKPAVGEAEQYLKCSGGQACVADKDCLLGLWGQWSACSCTCFGVRERHRTVSQFKSGDGKACVDKSLKTIEPCSPGVGQESPVGCENLAPVRDCELDNWTVWSACSASCGGGQKSKSRHVLVPPSGGGLPCTDTLAETTACNTHSCQPPHCLDCHWGQWSEWGGCTKCGGQRWRHRGVEQLPNYCGSKCDPRSGKEVGTCTSYCTPNLFCAWSEWSAYSPCPQQCGSATTRRHRALGLHRENRTVGNYLFKGTGSLTCIGSQFDVEACDSDTCQTTCVPRDCRFSAWAEWNQPQCTGLCERHRSITETNNDCGRACNGPLVATQRCEADCVKPVDCILNMWGMWSHCASEAAQRYRIRGIKQLPAQRGEPCTGPLRETAGCNHPKVAPADCQVSRWSDWGRCSRTCGGGWQTRNRRIKVPAVGGGSPCEDSLEELQACNSDVCERMHSMPCLMGQWLMWSDCKPNQQKYRQRPIIRYAMAGGAGCHDNMQETASCSASDIDCRVSPWTPFDPCDASCGGGQRQRHRQVENYPQLGGKACEERLSLVQTEGCNEHIKCATTNDCLVDEWRDWSSCSATCGVGQETRHRKVLQLRQQPGAGCNEALAETKTCAIKDCFRENCLWGEWSHWSRCSRTCGGGEQARARDIVREPMHGGATCVAQDKEEMQACNIQKCVKNACIDGEWADWANWDHCTRTCDGGITWRSREVKTTASSCGREPEGMSQEVGACNKGAPCQTDVDCMLSDWDMWDTCTASCFGVKARARRITRHGRGNGKFCAGALKESSPCNPGRGERPSLGCPIAGQPTDCVIAAWMQWQACSASCGGGQMVRMRKILVESRRGGISCQGDLEETTSCSNNKCPKDSFNSMVDCKWSEWNNWGACDKCGGQRKRFRNVATLPRNGGASCQQEASEETGPCPRKCHAKYVCSWVDWASWDSCSTTCGHGKRMRKRHLEPQMAEVAASSQYPQHANALWQESHADKGEDRDELHALYRRQRQIEGNHFFDMSVAFGCGCLFLMLALFASRVFSRTWQRYGGYSSSLEASQPFAGGNDESASSSWME